jgi:methionine-rich copper-binding protein CopC
MDGRAQSKLTSGVTAGIATISATVDNQLVTTNVIIKDTIPPTVTATTPKNGATGISKTATITIKFSENIKTSTYFNNITIKNQTTGRYITISKIMKGNTLTIKTSEKSANTWYTVTIPKSAIKDLAGNNLTANYIFKFKTGT